MSNADRAILAKLGHASSGVGSGSQYHGHRPQVAGLPEGAQNARRCRRDGRLRHTALDCNELP